MKECKKCKNAGLIIDHWVPGSPRPVETFCDCPKGRIMQKEASDNA